MGHSLGWDRNRPHSLPSYGLLSIGCPHLGCQRAAIHDVSCTLAALHARLARRRTGAARACIIASLYIFPNIVFFGKAEDLFLPKISGVGAGGVCSEARR